MGHYRDAVGVYTVAVAHFHGSIGSPRLMHNCASIKFVAKTEKLRDLPSVHEVLQRLESVLTRFPRALVTGEVRRALEGRRSDIQSGVANGGGELPVENEVERSLEALARPSLKR